MATRRRTATTAAQCHLVLVCISNRTNHVTRPLQAYLEGNEEVIREHCSPEMIERLTGIIKAQKAQVGRGALRGVSCFYMLGHYQGPEGAGGAEESSLEPCAFTVIFLMHNHGHRRLGRGALDWIPVLFYV